MSVKSDLMAIRSCLTFAALALCVSLTTACTQTSATIYRASGAFSPLLQSRSTVAVLPFESSPSYPGTGLQTRRITLTALRNFRGVTLLGPNKMDSILSTNNLRADEFDPSSLAQIAELLGADLLLWGRVNRYEPYHFDRLAPATPPYVDITLNIYSRNAKQLSTVSGHKQGGLPATIWGRQPNFEDVADPLVKHLLGVDL